MIIRKLKTVIALLLMSFAAVSNSWSASIKVEADPASREVYGCSGIMLDHASDGGQLLVSYYDSGSCTGTLGESNILWAFRLPTLPPGKNIKTASFHVYYITCYIKTVSGVTTVRLGPNESLYGIPYRSGSLSNPVMSMDTLVGSFGSDTTDCVPIQGNWIDLDSYPSWQHTSIDGTSALTQFILDQYNNGAKPGDWILLRQNSESRSTATTRNHFANMYYPGGSDPSTGSYNAYIEIELQDAFALGPGAPELKPGLTQVTTPIQHQPWFVQEREIYGYNPRYTPNPVAFGQDDHFYFKGPTWVETIDYQGIFLKNDFVNSIKSTYPNWAGTFEPCTDNRVYVDNKNQVYVLVKPTGIGICILHSKDMGRTWKVYKLPGTIYDALMECRDFGNDTSGAPAILVRYLLSGSNVLGLITISKDSWDNLVLASTRQVTTMSVAGSGFNAVGNSLVTRNSKTHIVFSSSTANASSGTPQYAVTYNRSTLTMGSAVYLGNAGIGEPNEKCWPWISIDKNGYLHVILNSYNGATGAFCKYLKSSAADSTTGGFSAAENLPSGLVRTSMVSDANSTVHVVAADISDITRAMKYTYKRTGQSWATPVSLVVPWNDTPGQGAPDAFYSPVLTLDERGRLFVSYSTKRVLKTAAQQTAYQAYNPCGTGAESPAVLAKQNATSWKLATSDAFVYKPSAVDTVLMDSQYLSAININYPGLEAVKAAIQSGDTALAKKEFAKHLRTRTEKVWWFDPQAKTSTAGTSSDLNYAYDFANHTNLYAGSYWLSNGEWDWLASWDCATNFVRMYFLENIGRAYWYSGTEYPAAVDYVNMMRSWIRQVKKSADPENHYWSTLATGIRLRSGWCAAFNYCVTSPVVDDDTMNLIVKSTIEQARHLRANPSSSGNWLTFEMAGLYSAGVMLPELTEATDWRQFACTTAINDMTESYLPDGAGVELSPNYGSFFSNYIMLSDLATAVDRLSEYNMSSLLSLCEEPFEYFIKIMAPDRKTPSYQDNSELDVKKQLDAYVDRYPNRPDFVWVAKEGSQGAPPSYTSCFTLYAGFAAMRSDWSRTANYLGFDVGPIGKTHAHEDKLNVVVWSYGRKVLFDSERVDYDDTPMNNWSADTFSHNTVIVDNRPQRRRWGTPQPSQMPYVPVSNVRWESDSVHDFASGVYEDDYGMQGPSDSYPYKDGGNFYSGWVKPAKHYRRVFFLKPDIFLVSDTLEARDGASHVYDVRWNLNTTNTAVRNSNWVATADSGLANLEVIPLITSGLTYKTTSGQMSPEILGWRCATTNVAATTLQHFKTGSGTVQFLTVLVPIRAGQSSPVQSVTATSATSWDMTLSGGTVVNISYDPNPAGNLSVSR